MLVSLDCVRPSSDEWSCMKVQTINDKTTPGTAATAMVEINGKVLELPAVAAGAGAYAHFVIHGLAVRYPTGKKVWPGSATYWPANGHINGVCGPQDHRNGRNSTLQIVGFWSDVQERYRSEHNSVVGGGR